jgi:2-hydroxy-3-keto-5-methylthiopentenyl-1-phosphate phosphatase
MSIRYQAIVSSDWNGCLAPCGPFDFIAFNYPTLKSELSNIFRQYTGNRISLVDAIRQIEQILSQPITREQMDAYLADSFATYQGVPELIDWCLNKNILFMINTTGMIGYFQRIFAKDLLPRVPVLSAHPMIRYPERAGDPPYLYELLETVDKGKNTANIVQIMGIPAEKVILMGDSGGDGPHFEWGSQTGAFLIGSMIKRSLDDYCRGKEIAINLRFGLSHDRGDRKDLTRELQINFMDLAATIEEIVFSDHIGAASGRRRPV